MDLSGVLLSTIHNYDDHRYGIRSFKISVKIFKLPIFDASERDGNS